MEILSFQKSFGFGRHWRRGKYQRLDVANKRNVKMVRLGGKQRRFWRIRQIPKLHLKIISPLKLLAKLKNAYVSMMLNLSGSVGALNSGNVFGGKRVPKARQVPIAYSNDEFDNRLVLEIYKSMIASRELGYM
ncbi:uncharacterized protein LOC117930456 [Vitis riparia]|uniref:Uncharacterized protein n=1 Tax=Vitis vinifera TaxID=29760 RepID=A0A438GZA5_VITVI|nr:uncharacterized protein LOC117930456 [Vitis riparia]RVW77513.1 hypothetical protein CK203_053468 [Vitis vinifera]